MSPEALNGVIDEFVTREGTDYGHGDQTLEAKRSQVRRQIEAGDVIIAFDAESETCNLVRRNDLPNDSAPRALGAKRNATAPVEAGSSPARPAAAANVDSLILDYVVEEDSEAFDQLTQAGLTSTDIRNRAAEIGLTNEFVKRLKLSGTRPAMRACLKCNAAFLSSGPHNRLCPRCH
jgi:hypothetical protein